MALEKELINGKGVKTAYHRIDSISMVDGIKVTVKSYTDESYRQQEKDRDALIKRDEEVKRLEEEMAKMGDEYDKEKVIALTEESNEIGFPEPLDLAIFVHTFQYPLDKNAVVSYEAMYQKLKQEHILKAQKMY